MYPDCLDCAHCYIDDIFNEVLCKLKFHFCEQIDDLLYEGRKENENRTIIECKDFKGKKYDD